MSAQQLAVQQLAIEQRLDYAECAADPCVFIERHVSIETLSGRAFRLRLWPFQRRTVEAIHEDRRVVVLKARRLGLSWLALAYALWVAIFQQGTRILVLCKNEGDAAELLDRVRRMRDRLAGDPASAHLLAGLRENRKARDAVTSLSIGASVIRALPAKERAARQETAAVVILDEFAFATEAPEIWRAILPTTEAEDVSELQFVDDSAPVLEGDGRLIVVSTGNGAEGTAAAGAEFARQYNRAASGESGFTALFWPWDARPDRDQDWKESKVADMGDEDRFRVEYPETPADAFVKPDTTLVYDIAGINAAKLLGREFDELRATQKMAPPAGGALELGIDWGVQTHVLIAWPLPAGGLYLVRELVTSHADVERTTQELAPILREMPFRVAWERFDAAGATENETFRKVFRREMGYAPKWRGIPFGKFKTLGIDYLQMLFRRTAEGKDSRRIAISPDGCPVLCEQLASLEFKDADIGKIDKGNDHGPDAAVTLAAELGAVFFQRS